MLLDVFLPAHYKLEQVGYFTFQMSLAYVAETAMMDPSNLAEKFKLDVIYFRSQPVMSYERLNLRHGC